MPLRLGDSAQRDTRHLGQAHCKGSGERDAAGWRAVREPETAPRASTPHQHQEKLNRFGLSLLMLTDIGSLPAWSLGPSLVGRYGSSVTWAELSGSALYPRFAATKTDSDKGGRIGWFAGQLAACTAPGETWPVAGCLGVEVGDLLGHGVGTAQSNWGHATWSAATAGAVYRGQLRRDWGLEIRAGAAIPFLRPEFGVRDYGQISRPDAVSLRFMAGLSWR